MVTKNEKSTNDLLHEISEKLDRISILLAIQGKNIDIQIRILRDSGLEWDEIGRYVGLKADAARKRYSKGK